MPRRPGPSPLAGPSTRPAARAAGVTDWRLRHRDVVRLSRDTYLPRAQDDDLRTRLPAVLMTAPAGAVISYQTAAGLWRVDVPMAPEREPVHLTVPASSRARDRRDRRLHRAELPADDVEHRWGMPVTSPARTWRDLAAVLQPAALLAVTDQLLGVLCTPVDLERALARRGSGRGAARARQVLTVADRRVDSPMVEGPACPPRLASSARAPAGGPKSSTTRGFGDLAWPGQKVLVEFDGDVHRERRVFVKDLRRQNRLVLEGWVVLRFSSADVVGRPEEVIAAVRRALGR